MSDNRTYGYDVVLELNDQVINDLLPVEPFPPVIGGNEFDIGGNRISIDYEIYFPSDPAVDILYFDTSIPDGVVVTTPFSLNITDLDIGSSLRNIEGAVNGVFSIHHPLVVYENEVGNHCIGFDFTDIPVDHIDVDVTELTDIPLGEELVENTLQYLIQAHLQHSVQYLSILCLPLSPDANPLTPDDIDVRVVTDECLALLVSTTSATTGNRDAFTSSEIPTGANSVLMVSNFTLLQHLICPFLMNTLNLEGETNDYFTYSEGTSELITPTALTDLVEHSLVDRITLESMQISIVDNTLSTTATLSMEGFGYMATARLAGQVHVSMDDDGYLVLSYSAEIADVDLYIYPWVWVLVALGVTVVPTLAGIVAVILPILAGLVNPILDSIASRFSISGEYSFPPFPLQIDAIILDDLMYSGRAITPPREPASGPQLSIESNVEVLDSSISDIDEIPILGPAGMTKITISSSHVGRYAARPSRMLFPITYCWRLDDIELSGNGTVNADGAMVHYTVDGDYCELKLDSGDSLHAELWVDAEASDEMKLSAFIPVDLEGSTVIGSEHGAHIIAGGHWMGIHESLKASDELPIEGAVSPYAASVSYTTKPGRNTAYELQIALNKGMGYDFPMQ